MCHFITYQKLKDDIAAYKFGFLEHGQLLLGCKIMLYVPEVNILVSQFMTDSSFVPYKYKCNLKGDKIIITEQENEQEIAFCMPVVSPVRNEIEIYNWVKAGLHISPLFKYKDNVYELMINIDEDDDPNYIKQVFIVAFHSKDILFFDGVDVSVRKFMILSPNKLIELLKKIEGYNDISVRIDISTQWLDDYKQIYANIIQKLIGGGIRSEGI